MIAKYPRVKRQDIVKSFKKGTIERHVADESTYGIRFYDNVNSRPSGGYLFRTFDNYTNRSSLALVPRFNLMTGIQQWRIQPGSVYYYGVVAPQLQFGSYYQGGGSQIYTLPSNLTLPNPW